MRFYQKVPLNQYSIQIHILKCEWWVIGCIKIHMCDDSEK